MLKIRIEVGSLAEPSVSGVGQYSKRLAEALNRHENVSATGFYFDLFNRRPKPQVDLPVKKLPMFQKVYSTLFKNGVKVPYDCFLPKVDATIFPNFATWPTRKSTLKITTIHDLTYLQFPETVEPKNLKFLQKIVPESIKEADLILNVSNSIKKEIVEIFPEARDKILALPIPPSETFSNFKSNHQPLAPSLGVKTPSFYLFVGNFEPRKNLGVLVKAYLKLNDELKSSHSLVIAGSKGWSNDSVQIEINEAIKNGANIIQTGNLTQTEIAQLMSEATCLVMPSLYEGFGMPIVEAMAVKCPVVASNIPVLRETANNIALFFDPNSPESLAKSLSEISNNHATRRSLARRGKEYVNGLSWDKNAKIIVDKINQLLRDRR